jgi:hypothetical protein
MKKRTSIIICLIAIVGLLSITIAQDKSIPPAEKEVPFDKAPEVVKKVNPVYPANMLHEGMEAIVYLKAFIDMNGDVVEAKSEKMTVTEKKTSERGDEATEEKVDGKPFVEAAQTAIKQWKFKPAQINGKPVAVWVTIPIRFKLSSIKEPLPIEEGDKAEVEKRIESIKMAIEEILKGKELENAKKFVGKAALLVYNAKTVNLISVLNGEHKDIHLIEGKETQCVNLNINITGGGTSGLIVWTSELPNGKNKRIHSIVLSKSSATDWKIVHWHVSW